MIPTKYKPVPAMWKLEMRGARGTPFTDLGSFASINDAAQAVLKTENDQSGAIFFRIYAIRQAYFSPPTRTCCPVSITKPPLAITYCRGLRNDRAFPRSSAPRRASRFVF